MRKGVLAISSLALVVACGPVIEVGESESYDYVILESDFLDNEVYDDTGDGGGRDSSSDTLALGIHPDNLVYGEEERKDNDEVEGEIPDDGSPRAPFGTAVANSSPDEPPWDVSSADGVLFHTPVVFTQRYRTDLKVVADNDVLPLLVAAPTMGSYVRANMFRFRQGVRWQIADPFTSILVEDSSSVAVCALIESSYFIRKKIYASYGRNLVTIGEHEPSRYSIAVVPVQRGKEEEGLNYLKKTAPRFAGRYSTYYADVESLEQAVNRSIRTMGLRVSDEDLPRSWSINLQDFDTVRSVDGARSDRLVPGIDRSHAILHTKYNRTSLWALETILKPMVDVVIATKVALDRKEATLSPERVGLTEVLALSILLYPSLKDQVMKDIEFASKSTRDSVEQWLSDVDLWVLLFESELQMRLKKKSMFTDVLFAKEVRKLHRDNVGMTLESFIMRRNEVFERNMRRMGSFDLPDQVGEVDLKPQERVNRYMKMFKTGDIGRVDIVLRRRFYAFQSAEALSSLERRLVPFGVTPSKRMNYCAWTSFLRQCLRQQVGRNRVGRAVDTNTGTDRSVESTHSTGRRSAP